jgi:RNA polymerase sigma factor (sigma-70 family)
MPVPPAYDLEKLLAEDPWIRRLARRLVRDDHAAEDLVQETWVAALDARAAPRALRPWLGGILRNLWRDGESAAAARTRRETRAARDEALGATSELVAELELRKAVAEALLALEEPWRSALYLRFFKDQSLAAIARRQGIGVSSAHERVQQGLARLRARLDQAHGGRRGAWAVGLLALARPDGIGTAVAEGIAMAGGLKLAASVLVIGGGVAWFLVGSERGAGSSELAAATPAPVSPAAQQVDALPGPAPAAERAELAAEPAPAAAPPEARPEPAARLFEGRVVDVLGAPLAGLEVGWRGSNEERARVRTAPDGAFALASSSEGNVVALEAGFTTLVPAYPERSLAAAENTLLVAAPRADAAGLVLDPEGAPVAGAKVVFRLRDELYRALGLHRGELGGEAWRTESDADGAFALADIAGGPRVYLEVTALGFEAVQLELPPAGARELVVRLSRGHTELVIRGVVLDPRGSPLPGAHVSAGDEIATSDADGRFVVELFELPDSRVPDALAAWREEQRAARSELIALAAGHGPARMPLSEVSLDEEVTLRLEPRAETIAGRVVDPAGEPVAGAVVWPTDPTKFGREHQSLSEGTDVAWNKWVEDELAGGYGKLGATSDAKGAFELGALLPRAYSLRVFRPETGDLAGPFTVTAGGRGVELVLAREEPRALVAGRVRSAGGVPLAGVEVEVRRISEATDVRLQAPFLARRKVVTDAEGRFTLGETALAGTALVLQDPRFFVREERLDAHPDPSALELVEAVLCELQVDLAGDPTLADALRVLDADGRELETMEGFGNAWSMGTEARFSGGLSPLLLVRETAATLVLRKDGAEVLRKPLRLDPAERTIARP